jgi:hypothetical protein
LSAGCASKRALFREGRFLIHNSPLNALKPAGIALTSDAAQVAGLGRIYFGTSFSPRIFADRRGLGKIHKHERPGVHHLVLDYSLFILLYLDSTYAAEKNWFVPGFPKTLLDVHKQLAASIAFALRS